MNPSQPDAMKASAIEAVTSKPEGGARKVGRWRTVAIGAASLLTIEVVLWLGHRLLPPVYFAKVLMEVKPDNSSGIANIYTERHRRTTLDPMFAATQFQVIQKTEILNPIIATTYTERAGRTTLDPMFTSTQFQVLRKTEILYPVIENLKLVDAWSTAARPMTVRSAYIKLLGMLEFREIQKPELIEIGVYSKAAQEAANIANTIAVVYQQKRLSDLQKNIPNALEQLKDEVERQRKRMDESAAEMEKIRLRDGINDPNPLEFGSSAGGLEEDRRLLAIGVEMNLAKANLGKLRLQVERFMNLKPEQLKSEDLKRELRFLEIQDVTVDGMIEELQAAEEEFAKLLDADLGENRPRLAASRELKGTLTKKLADQLNVIRSSQTTKVRSMEGVVADLGRKLELAKSDQIKGKQKANDYHEAKVRHLQNKRTLEAVQTRYSGSLLERGINFDPAKIWEKAEAPAKPLPLSFARFEHAFSR
ncbi:MAG TPA: hypothetical protein VFD27_22695 [Chthoniobacteraceae bacterium]|nr:hypothetical protein [Chthoniobacteraceae bacterium]